MNETLHKNRYPVVDRDYKAFLYEPNPEYPTDHVYNLNRHDWNLEDKEKLLFDTLGTKSFKPSKTWVAAIEFEPNAHSTCIDPQPSTAHEWSFARAVSFGDECFDEHQFDKGAITGFGDYFFYFATRSTKLGMDNGSKLIFLPDTSILMWVEHPTQVTNKYRFISENS